MCSYCRVLSFITKWDKFFKNHSFPVKKPLARSHSEVQQFKEKVPRDGKRTLNTNILFIGYYILLQSRVVRAALVAYEKFTSGTQGIFYIDEKNDTLKRPQKIIENL